MYGVKNISKFSVLVFKSYTSKFGSADEVMFSEAYVRACDKNLIYIDDLQDFLFEFVTHDTKLGRLAFSDDLSLTDFKIKLIELLRDGCYFYMDTKIGFQRLSMQCYLRKHGSFMNLGGAFNE